MSKISVFERGWIDLVFEGRNKAYGAYQLRKDDGKTTMKAFFSGLGFMSLLVAIPVVMNSFKPAPVTEKTPEGIIIEPGIIPVEHIKPIEPPKAEPETPAQKNPNKTVRFVKPVAASDPTPDNLPTTKQVQGTEVSKVTSEGDGRDIVIGPSSPTGTLEGTGTSEMPTTGTGRETIETFVDEMPEFPGGVNNFLKEVGNKFRVPEVNRVMQMRVYVSFVVEPDGTMTNIKVGRDPGYNLAAEAERVLKSIKTKWKPGKKKGKAVRTAYSLPILVNVK
jgi:periplasmic protein TonB